MPTIEPRFIDAGGIRTHVLEAGDNAGVPLVLLHGSGHGVSASANWGGVMSPLVDRGYRVVAPELAGFGDTDFSSDTEYGIRLWTQHLSDILDTLGIERAVLVGNSFGGGVSLATAAREPQRVAAMVLLGTPAGSFAMTEGLAANWTYEPSLEAMERILRLFPYDQAIVTAEMIEARYQASTRPGALEAFARLMPAPSGDANPVVKGMPEAILNTIGVPTLVLHGRDDQVVPPNCASLLLEALPDVEAHVFGQCGHWVQIERRDAFVALVHDFASRRAEA